jgi:hypothetical protein
VTGWIVVGLAGLAGGLLLAGIRAATRHHHHHPADTEGQDQT